MTNPEKAEVDILATAKEQLRLIDVVGMCDSGACGYHAWIKAEMSPVVNALELLLARVAELEKGQEPVITPIDESLPPRQYTEEYLKRARVKGTFEYWLNREDYGDVEQLRRCWNAATASLTQSLSAAQARAKGLTDNPQWDIISVSNANLDICRVHALDIVNNKILCGTTIKAIEIKGRFSSAVDCENCLQKLKESKRGN